MNKLFAQPNSDINYIEYTVIPSIPLSSVLLHVLTILAQLQTATQLQKHNFLYAIIPSPWYFILNNPRVRLSWRMFSPETIRWKFY